MKICGIDPGLSGGIAFLEANKTPVMFKMPLHPDKSGVDVRGLIALLTLHRPHAAFIEEPFAPFKSSRKSILTVGRNFGLMLAAFDYHLVAYEIVPVATWQTTLGTRGTPNPKDAAYKLANLLFPDTDFRHSKKATNPHDGLVDACLLAHYGLQKMLVA